MKLLFVSVSAAAFAIATPAAAQEQTEFSGPYVGINAGYDHVTLDDGTDKGSKDGLEFGVVAGYDFQSSVFVGGFEAEVAGATTKESVSDVLQLGDRVSLKASRDLYAGVRAGYVIAPNVLLYAKGGYTNARFTASYTTAGGAVTKDGDNLDGFRLGAGVEYRAQRFGARVEYRYSDYGNYSTQGFNTGISVRRQQVVATIIAKL
jgi:outer membrane immunogenic protein